MTSGSPLRPTLLVLASTYPRWEKDAEPGFVHALSKRLGNGFRVIVLCPHADKAKEREVFEGVDVWRYRYAPACLETLVNDGGIVTNLRNKRWKWLLVPGFVLVQAYQAWRICRRESVDVIHAHWLIPQGVIAGLLQMLAGRTIPYVVTSHGADLYALKGGALTRLKRWVMKRAAAVTVVSKAMVGEVGAIGGSAEGISVLPMGVDMMGTFSPDVTKARSENELLFVGRLVEKKGVGYLLDALPAVRTLRPGIRLKIVGFGPELDALRRKVADLQLEDAITFSGAVSQEDLPAILQSATLLIAPFVKAQSGDQEGLGLVPVEAIACGCPVLIGDLPAVRDIIDDEFVDFLVDPTDRNALARAILDALSNYDIRLKRTELLRSRLMKRFDWSFVSDKYVKLLHAATSHDGNAYYRRKQ